MALFAPKSVPMFSGGAMVGPWVAFWAAVDALVPGYYAPKGEVIEDGKPVPQPWAAYLRPVNAVIGINSPNFSHMFRDKSMTLPWVSYFSVLEKAL